MYADRQGKLAAAGGKWANLARGILDALHIELDSAFLEYDLAMYFALIGLEQEALAIFEKIAPRVLRILGRPVEALATTEARLAEDPASFFLHWNDLGLALAAVGDFARARPILEQMWQRSSGKVTLPGVFRVEHAAALVAIRRDAAERGDVANLIDAIEDNVRRYRESGYIGTKWYFNANYDEGLAAYLSGEREEGLELIASAADGGYFILPNEAYLQTLYNDPDFTPILAGQEVRQARERKRFLAIVCTDNPYEKVWQPAEGTCERVAAEGGN